MTSTTKIMRQVLITGANGQLGSEIRELQSLYPQMHFHFTDIAELDITNSESVALFLSENKIDLIINCAAYTAVDKAEEEAELATSINAVAPELLARLSDENGIRFIHVSTDYVFDGNAFLPYTEEDQTAPTSSYGKTKLAGERLVFSANPKAVVVRTSWLYSSFGNNFVKTMMRLGSERESLNVVFDQIGSPTNAADLGDALLKIGSKLLDEDYSKAAQGGVYHYSNEGVCSWYDFAVEIMELSDLDCAVFPITSDKYPTPAKRPAYSVLNKDKIKSDFELSIPHWRRSLRNCIEKLKIKYK